MCLQHLRVMAVEEARLMEEVQLMKDLFLLGRGELFLEFIRLANTSLSQTPTALTLRGESVDLCASLNKLMHVNSV